MKNLSGATRIFIALCICSKSLKECQKEPFYCSDYILLWSIGIIYAVDTEDLSAPLFVKWCFSKSYIRAYVRNWWKTVSRYISFVLFVLWMVFVIKHLLDDKTQHEQDSIRLLFLHFMFVTCTATCSHKSLCRKLQSWYCDYDMPSL